MTPEPPPPAADSGTRLVSMSDAAALLGVTSDAIRHRIRRGSLTADKVGGRWYVRLPADLPPAPDAHLTKPDTVSVTVLAGDLTKPGVDQSEPDTHLAVLVERLEQENKWLRRRLEDADAERERTRQAMDDERREQRRLLLNEQQRLAEVHAQLARLLPASTQTPDTAPDASGVRPASSGQLPVRPPAPSLAQRVRRFLYGERRR